MNKQEILEAIKRLASSQGFYTRIYHFLSDTSEESTEFLDILEKENFKDVVDLIIYLEN